VLRCSSLYLKFPFISISHARRRYENLLLRLFLPPAFLNLALVTLFADTFAVLYLTTLVRRERERGILPPMRLRLLLLLLLLLCCAGCFFNASFSC